MREAQDIEGYRKIKEQEWPSELYMTIRVDGAVEDAELTTDVLVWEEVPKISQQTSGLYKRYEALRSLKGKKAAAYVKTTIEDFNGGTTERDQALLKLQTDGSEDDCFHKLKEAREFMEKRGRQHIALYSPGSFRGQAFRKMIECAFGTSDVKCTVYYKGMDREDKRTARKNNTNAVIVTREQGGTYADLLKKVKEVVNKDEKGISQSIRNLRGTRNGDLVITTSPGGDTMVSLKKLLSDSGDLKVRASRGAGKKMRTVNIKGMDAVATKGEVAEAVKRETGELPIRLGELRPCYGNCQAANLTVTQERAQRLITKQTIRIGLNNCGLSEKVEVTQCYRCWGYGHIAAACGGSTDRSADCKNCGGGGHSKTECKRDKSCPLCKKEGHRVGEGACAVLRQALREAKRRSRLRLQSKVAQAGARKPIKQTGGE